MKIEFREAKSVITKSNIPSIDYVINPYIGCQHGCIYCYAEFMKRFTDHGGDTWGKFLDVKQFNWNKINPHKYKSDKTIMLSSVTDPYTPSEKKYQNTRRILEKMVGTEAKIEILTKSKLVTRDIDLFKKFKNISVGISINTLDASIAKIIEPLASKPMKRIEALREIGEHNIPTWVFVSPVFPRITDWKAIVQEVSSITKTINFENLNFRGHNISRIMDFLAERFPELVEFYKQIQKNPTIWDGIGEEIDEFCQSKGLNYDIGFHHGGFTKNKNENKNKKKNEKRTNKNTLSSFLNEK
ncbi:MAG: radical SAM protein [archaeon]|nr:radical SAM protein [archaeon]